MSDKEKMHETVHQFTEEVEVAGRDVIGKVKELLQDASVHRIKVINKSHDEVVLDIPAVAGAGGALLLAPLAPWLLLGVAAMYVMNFKIVVERRGEVAPDEVEVVDVVDESATDESDDTTSADEIIIEEMPADAPVEAAEVEEVEDASEEPDVEADMVEVDEVASDEPEVEIVIEKSQPEAVADASEDAEAVEIEHIADRSAEVAAEEPEPVVESVVEDVEPSAEIEMPVEAVEEIEIETIIEDSAEPAVVEELDRCQGMTKAGTQCKRKPMEGSAYCYAHQPE